jgi:hypothetical protein
LRALKQPAADRSPRTGRPSVRHHARLHGCHGREFLLQPFHAGHRGKRVALRLDHAAQTLMLAADPFRHDMEGQRQRIHAGGAVLALGRRQDLSQILLHPGLVGSFHGFGQAAQLGLDEAQADTALPRIGTGHAPQRAAAFAEHLQRTHGAADFIRAVLAAQFDGQVSGRQRVLRREDQLQWPEGLPQPQQRADTRDQCEDQRDGRREQLVPDLDAASFGDIVQPAAGADHLAGAVAEGHRRNFDRAVAGHQGAQARLQAAQPVGHRSERRGCGRTCLRAPVQVRQHRQGAGGGGGPRQQQVRCHAGDEDPALGQWLDRHQKQPPVDPFQALRHRRANPRGAGDPPVQQVERLAGSGGVTQFLGQGGLDRPPAEFVGSQAGEAGLGLRLAGANQPGHHDRGGDGGQQQDQADGNLSAKPHAF